MSTIDTMRQWMAEDSRLIDYLLKTLNAKTTEALAQARRIRELEKKIKQLEERH